MLKHSWCLFFFLVLVCIPIVKGFELRDRYERHAQIPPLRRVILLSPSSMIKHAGTYQKHL